MLRGEMMIILMFGQQALCVVMPKKYQDIAINIEHLMALGMVAHPDGMHYWQQIVNHYFNDKQAIAQQVPIRSYVNQLNQILVPVAKGLAFAVLPQFAVDSFAQQTQICIATFDNAGESKQGVSEPLFLINKKHRPLAKRYQPIIDIIHNLV